MMKKFVCLFLVFAMLCTFASAECVYVTISDDQGNLGIAHEAVTVNDIDGDGAITINDALHCAHEAYYEGGAQAGFASSKTDYGRSLDCLWGVANGGSYGYYVDNVSALSLLDPIAEGSHLQAYAFTDLETWSDVFSFFNTAEIKSSEAFELTLNAQTYDADWNPVFIPVEGAEITVNGEVVSTTDTMGVAVIEIIKPGRYIISAQSDSMTLVPPVCIVEII